MTRIALVDDHRLLTEGLTLLLRCTGHEVVTVDAAGDVVRQVRDHEAAIVLLDLDLGGGRTGDALIPALVALGCGVLVLTAEERRARWGDCLRAGAAGVVAKAADGSVILTAVTALADGRPAMSAADRAACLLASDRARQEAEQHLAPFRRLTGREREVLQALVDGTPAAVIARRTVVSEATVRSHIRAVLAKLGVGSQLQAVALARWSGWHRP